MKAALRLLCFPPLVILVFAVLVYDAACEAAKKRRLGRDYEGPAED